MPAIQSQDQKQSPNQESAFKASWDVLVVWECEVKRPGELAGVLGEFF